MIDWTGLDFSTGKLDDGLDLIKAKHLFNIKATKEQGVGKPTLVSAFCIPEMKIREAYRLWMEIDDKNKPVAHGCSCPFGAYLCKHKAALVLYAKNNRNETQTDQDCTFIKPSEYSLKLYPRGQELEKIKKIREKDCCPKLTFDMISDQEKRTLANLMEAHGVTKSPLFFLAKSRFQSKTPTENMDEILKAIPEWIKKRVFVETKVEDIPYKVIRFKFLIMKKWLFPKIFENMLHSMLRKDLNKKSEVREVTFFRILKIIFFSFLRM